MGKTKNSTSAVASESIDLSSPQNLRLPCVAMALVMVAACWLFLAQEGRVGGAEDTIITTIGPTAILNDGVLLSIVSVSALGIGLLLCLITAACIVLGVLRYRRRLSNSSLTNEQHSHEERGII